MRTLLNDDVRLALAPGRSYERLLSGRGPAGWRETVRRPALIALLIGTAVAIAATGRVSTGLLISTTLAWSWVVGVQVVMAAAVILTGPGAGVRFRDALALWFAGHVPWTLWLLGLGPTVRAFPSMQIEALLGTMLLPMAWTAVIAAAFSRVVLRRGPGAAWLIAVAHQVVVFAAVLSYVAWAAGGWFRIFG